MSRLSFSMPLQRSDDKLISQKNEEAKAYDLTTGLQGYREIEAQRQAET